MPAGLGYELVGKDGHNNIRCRGAELVGATFRVAGSAAGAMTLRISQIGLTPQSAGISGKYLAYLITPQDQPASSLCSVPSPGATATPILRIDFSKNKLADVSVEDLAGYVIIIPGAVYDAAANLILESIDGAAARQGSAARWFNFACTTDALAQTELSGVAAKPIVDSATASARLPALHMFTAKYCNGISATERGTLVAWQQNSQRSPRRTDVGPIEAEWGPSGATCASHSRLWIADKAVSLPADLVGNPQFSDLPNGSPAALGDDEFLRRLCSQLPKCGATVPANTLASFTVNHQD